MFEDLYYLVDIEEEIAESITFSISELYEAPSFKKIVNRPKFCGRMNDVKQTNTTERGDSHDVIIQQRGRDWQALGAIF